MAEQWFYVAEGVQKGPVDRERLAELAKALTLLKPTLVWKAGMEEWRPASEVFPDFFTVPTKWLYAGPAGQAGPVDTDQLLSLVKSGQVQTTTLLWREGMPEWKRASEVLPHVFAVPPVPPAGALPAAKQRGLIGRIGAKISDVADLPTISGVPLSDVLVGGLGEAASFRAVETEDTFAVGTKQTTPKLTEIQATWPKLKVFWRMLAGSLATYSLLWYGLSHFGNTNCFPGLMVVGSFVVPFSVVVAFFELNVTRNVSIYEVGKMLMLGGALSLVVTLTLITFLPGSGTGNIVPAILTGVGEETGKALVLLIVVYSLRYPYQLNGLLFGAAVGAGFAGFESAGYALNSGMDAFVGYGVQQAVNAGAHSIKAFDVVLMEQGMRAFVVQAADTIWFRGILAPGGHVIWTAMIGSALWKAKGEGPFSLSLLFHRVVVRRWTIAVVLHGIWDADFSFVPDMIKLALLIAVGWYLIAAICKQALGEVAQAKARMGAGATLTMHRTAPA